MKRINRNAAFFIIADGFYYGGHAVLNAFLSLLITNQIAPGRLDLAGYVVSYYLIIRAITELPLSSYIQRFDNNTKRLIVVFGYLIYGVLIMITGHATDIWQIFFLQTFIALIDATTYPIRWPLFTKVIDRGNEELEWGVEDVASTLLPAIFSAAAGAISEIYGVTAAFYVFGPVFMLSGLLFSQIRIKK